MKVSNANRWFVGVRMRRIHRRSANQVKDLSKVGETKTSIRLKKEAKVIQ